jgi:ribosome-associated protein
LKTKNNQSFALEEEYIELNTLLKFMGVAESGAHAKQLVDEGLVKLNGKPESRRRAKCRNGDVVEVAEMTIRIE